MKNKLLLVLFLMLSLHPAVRAQQILSFTTTVPPATANWTKPLQLPAFDSGLGTLAGVTLTYAAEVWQSVYIENLDDDCMRFDLSTTATLALGRPGETKLINLNPITLHRRGSVGEFDGGSDFAGHSGVKFTQHLQISGVYVDANLAGYLGHELIDFNAIAKAVSAISAGGNMLAGTSSTASATLSVEYAYAPIPEPAFLTALAGGAALATAMLRRRRAALLG